MKELEEKIIAEGHVLPGNILSVGSFLNQQIDTVFMMEMGREIARLFAGEGITKVLTVEASGIAIAVAAGAAIGCPAVFAKKHRSSNVRGNVYKSRVHSFTHGNDNDIVVSSEFLLPDDRVLIVDDFLASGNALHGLMEIVRQSGASLAGIAVAIEKGFQGGGDSLRRMGVHLESLAIVEEMSEGSVTFRKQ